MTRAALRAQHALPHPTPTLDQLCARFNFAFRRTRDLEAAMRAVNELLEHALTYREFLGRLRAAGQVLR